MLIVGIDIDDKKDEIVKDVVRINGIKFFDDFCKQHHYDPYETLSGKTRSGGYHFYFYVDKETLITLGKNKTDVHYGVNKATSIDVKTTDGFFICAPSKLKCQDTEQKYIWLSNKIDFLKSKYYQIFWLNLSVKIQNLDMKKSCKT
jgi:hypothetical protein